MFNVDFGKFALLLLPPILRRGRLWALLRALAAPLADLHARFMERREADLLCLATDCTIPRLEYLLNRTFYPAGLDAGYAGRIRVVNNAGALRAVPLALGGVIQPVDEHAPQWMGTLYLPSVAEMLAERVDFIVEVPAAVGAYDKDRMAAMVAEYALPDKVFIINDM